MAMMGMIKMNNFFIFQYIVLWLFCWRVPVPTPIVYVSLVLIFLGFDVCIEGVAGSGKSLLNKVLIRCYCRGNVGFLFFFHW